MPRNSTKIEIIDDKKVMVKTMSTKLYNPAIYDWQNEVHDHFLDNTGFYINKVLGHSNGVLHLDYIDYKSKPTTNKDLQLFGKSMAKLHNSGRDWNFSWTMARNGDAGWIKTSLPYKDETYSTMASWNNIRRNDWLFLKSKGIRKEIFETLKTLDKLPDQPKSKLHRDFRLHNILYDERGYHLIDFDFASIDFISLEVMGLFTDLYELVPEMARQFLIGYHSESKDWEWSSGMVDLFLCYLCTNTFPFSMSSHMDKNEVEALADERNARLRIIYENKENILKMIEEIK